jgi:hypothetical protein
MSHTAELARKELELVGEEPDVIDWYCRVIDEFHTFGHSGGSFFATLPVLIKLLEQKNLTELTNSPDEWVDIAHYNPGVSLWQNNRNGEAFSHDGGKTYYLLSEGGNDQNRKPLHTAKDHS